MSTMEEPPEGAIQLGPKEWYNKVYLNGVWVGINEWHRNSIDNLCGGWVPFESHNPQYGWAVVSEEPFTLSPSLLCTTCQHHGWIRDGKWESA